MIAEHGHATYGGNSHLVADADEAWVVIEFAGGQGLWAAERLGGDSIRVSRPGYIGDVPVKGDGGQNWLWSPNFISFAAEQGWYDPASGGAFNVNKIYGDGRYRWDGVAWVEGELAKLAARPEKIGLHDVMSFVATERLTGDTAGYGQVVPLLGQCHTALRMMWHAHIGAATAPFTPVFLGIRRVPEEFRQHRYLSDREAQRFIDPRHQQNLSVIPRGIESTRSATVIFKRLQYLAFEHHDHFLAEVQSVWRGLERRLDPKSSDIARLAGLAINASEVELAERCLTSFTEEALLQSLEMAEDLARSIELRTRILYDINSNAAGLGPEQIW
jgi:dipeptidase